MSEEERFKVQIVRRSDGGIEWESNPTNQRHAQGVADGAGINLDWENYSVRMVDADFCPTHGPGCPTADGGRSI